jgi:hypothetical protein
MRVERIEELESLSETQRHLLAGMLERGPLHPDLVLTFPEGTDLVVYWLDDGDALVAPRNPSIRPGAVIEIVGGTASAQRVGVSEGQVVEEVELAIAVGVRRAHWPLHR